MSCVSVSKVSREPLYSTAAPLSAVDLSVGSQGFGQVFTGLSVNVCYQVTAERRERGCLSRRLFIVHRNYFFYIPLTGIVCTR